MENEVKLLSQSQKFPLRISEKLERKIRVLCGKFPSTEWSGILFYTYKGSFAKGDIAFVAEDLLFMDTGYSTTTEFYLNEGNAAGYIADHELWRCQMGLIHSHHQMGAFFSGQDDSMLKQEGASRNHFLSLVVDNKGTYVARVTTKEIEEITTEVSKVNKVYTFNNVLTETTTGEDIKTESHVIVNYHDLDITNDYRLTCDDYEELMETIKQCDLIKKEREERERKEEEENKKKNTPIAANPFFGKKEKKKKGKKGKGQPSFCPGFFQPDAESEQFNKEHAYRQTEENWEELPFTREDDPFGVQSQYDEVPDKVLTDGEVEYYASQILSLGLLHTTTQGMEEFLKDMKPIMSLRFNNMKQYEEAVQFVCDYLLDTELFNKIEDEHFAFVDEAFEVAKKQIGDYFLNMLVNDAENEYLSVICDYISK